MCDQIEPGTYITARFDTTLELETVQPKTG